MGVNLLIIEIIAIQVYYWYVIVDLLNRKKKKGITNKDIAKTIINGAVHSVLMYLVSGIDNVTISIIIVYTTMCMCSYEDLMDKEVTLLLLVSSVVVGVLTVNIDELLGNVDVVFILITAVMGLLVWANKLGLGDLIAIVIIYLQFINIGFSASSGVYFTVAISAIAMLVYMVVSGNRGEQPMIPYLSISSLIVMCMMGNR